MSSPEPAGGRRCEVLVTGAGPAGLSLALAALGLHIAIVECQDQATIRPRRRHRRREPGTPVAGCGRWRRTGER